MVEIQTFRLRRDFFFFFFGRVNLLLLKSPHVDTTSSNVQRKVLASLSGHESYDIRYMSEASFMTRNV